MKQILVIFILVSNFFFTPAYADSKKDDKAPLLPQGDFSALRVMNPQFIDQVIDGLRLKLKNDHIVQLSSIEIPGIDPYEPSDISIQAKEFLTSLLKDKEVRLYQSKDPDKGRLNRMGYDLAHLERKDGDIWIQGALLANGFARALPSAHNPEMAAQMFALEQTARTEKRGMWADEQKGHYTVLTPDTTTGFTGQFVLVEGTVKTVAAMKNRVFLNFGPDWRSDFTISIEPSVRKDLAKKGIDTIQLDHKRIRVRGWLEEWNGPHIKLTHPTLLELLPDSSEASMLSP